MYQKTVQKYSSSKTIDFGDRYDKESTKANTNSRLNQILNKKLQS